MMRIQILVATRNARQDGMVGRGAWEADVIELGDGEAERSEERKRQGQQTSEGICDWVDRMLSPAVRRRNRFMEGIWGC